ncbi:MAG: hypothetical protein BWZ10_03011 [candidate division BRC1 bacterium ADurb.BinA364]|nr:MAG: hypothetical protein BWZ10_03011 [candidate division BRC1 bacterium ADurb.BinA364]
MSPGDMPMPVSSTSMRARTECSSCRSHSTRIVTWPLEANLIPLPARFITIWRMRTGSPRSFDGMRGEYTAASSTCWRRAGWLRISATASISSSRSKSMVCRVILPASILEKSSTSSMMANKALELSTMALANSRCSPEISVSIRSAAMPTTPFIGVRISWLMFARKALLAMLAASARTAISLARSIACSSCRLACASSRLAFSSSASACLRSVMSRHTPKMCFSPPIW